MLAISAVEFVQCRWVALALIVVVGGQVVTLPDHHPPIGLLCYSSRSVFENTCWPLESVKANHDEARGLPDIAKVVGVVARDGPLARANSALFQMFVDGYASQKDGPVHRSTGSAGWRSDPSSESGCG